MSEKRLAIVTGGARNIGRAIVFALLKQGRKVVAVDIMEDTLSELKELTALVEALHYGRRRSPREGGSA